MAKMDLIFGDGFSLIKNIPDNSVDLIVTDPPYGINFTLRLPLTVYYTETLIEAVTKRI